MINVQKDVTEEDLMYLGRIKAYLLPAGEKDEVMEWWQSLRDAQKEQYQAAEAKNLITTNGKTNILTYVGAASVSSLVAFCQYFSVGTGTLSQVFPGDSAMVGELARAVPSTATVSGNTVNISTFFGTSQANGTYTNAGIFGNNATSTLGTGTLMTHALFSLTKTSANSLTVDYLISIA